jgi:8-oxo-dGTP pyrophosphatase MutT (NUDIX family)
MSSPIPSTSSANLIALLRRHTPFDAAESACRDQTLRWLAETPDPLNRHNFTPGHATGSAFIITPARDHVMLVLHGKLNLWLQPGGHAEPGETDPLLVACRESEEEVGLTLNPATAHFHDIDVHRVPARGPSPEHLHFDFRYLFAIPRTPLTAASDALEARWFTIPEAIQITTDLGVLRMIHKLTPDSPVL